MTIFWFNRSPAVANMMGFYSQLENSSEDQKNFPNFAPCSMPKDLTAEA